MNKNLLLMIFHRVLDWQKDPNPEHWRTISGAKVHLDQNGEIDGGAGGKFTGNYWDGKKGQQHIIGPHTMMRKNIGSGATSVGLAGLGAFGKIEPTKPTEPTEPVKPPEEKPKKKPAKPKEPEFTFPEIKPRTKPADFKNIYNAEKRIKRAISWIREFGDNSTYSQSQIKTIASFANVPTDELLTPETETDIAEQFGSLFSEANNARKKKYGAADIQRYKDALAALKTQDPDLTELRVRALRGINLKTLGMEPEKAYKEWLKVADQIIRVTNEKANGVTTTYDEWKKTTSGRDSKERDPEFRREQAINEQPEYLKRQAKVYKPESVVGVPKGPDMNFEDADGKKSNPNYRHIWDKDYKEGYRVNCQTCVIAYEMRRRGYNVEALPRAKGANLNLFQDAVARWGSGVDDDGSAKAWIRPDGTHPIPKEMTGATVQEQYDWLANNMEDNARYTFCFCWRGGGAHIIHAYKENGKAILYDPQSGEQTTERDKVEHYLGRLYGNGNGRYKPKPRLTRVDDCAPDMFYVNRILTPAK